MSRKEKLLTAAVVVVNLSVGYWLASRADYSGLFDADVEAPEPIAALTPAD